MLKGQLRALNRGTAIAGCLVGVFGWGVWLGCLVEVFGDNLNLLLNRWPAVALCIEKTHHTPRRCAQ